MNLELSTLTDQLIILFTLVLIGFIATKLHLLSERTSRVLSDLVVNVTNPCAVLASVLSGARILTNAQVLMLGGTAVGMYLVLMLLAQPLPYLLRANPQQRGVLRFMTVFPNMSFLGSRSSPPYLARSRCSWPPSLFWYSSSSAIATEPVNWAETAV